MKLIISSHGICIGRIRYTMLTIEVRKRGIQIEYDTYRMIVRTKPGNFMVTDGPFLCKQDKTIKASKSMTVSLRKAAWLWVTERGMLLKPLKTE